MIGREGTNARRLGATYLEVAVAMVVFAIALAGLCPLMVMQLRLLRKIESPDAGSTNLQLIRGARMLDGTPSLPSGQSEAALARVIRPQPDAWVRRLGALAAFQASATSQSYQTVPSQQTVAVGDSGFSADGWTAGQNPAQTGTGIFTRSPTDPASGPASWTFGAIAPGYYRVLALWPPSSGNTTSASYTLNLGSVPVPASPMNQQSLPPSTGLGVFFLNGSLVVELAGSDTARVVADAVRIVPLNAITILAPAAQASGGYQVSVGVVPQ
jgi:type II secretory pathway pseudopilin PulG